MVARPDHWAFEGTGPPLGDTFGERDPIVAYEVDGCAFTITDGQPSHARGRQPRVTRDPGDRTGAALVAGPEPTRYAHEPGELEPWRRPYSVMRAVARGAGLRQPRRDGGVHAPGDDTVVNIGVIDWTFGLSTPTHSTHHPQRPGPTRRRRRRLVSARGCPSAMKGWRVLGVSLLGLMTIGVAVAPTLPVSASSTRAAIESRVDPELGS